MNSKGMIMICIDLGSAVLESFANGIICGNEMKTYDAREENLVKKMVVLLMILVLVAGVQMGYAQQLLEDQLHPEHTGQALRDALRSVAANAITSTYGITPDQCEEHFMSSVMKREVDNESEVWIVTFVSKHDVERLGEYRVLFSSNKFASTDITWTHDGFYVYPTGAVSLDRQVWGSAELAYYDEVSHHYVDMLRETEALYGSIDKAPMESKAALSDIWTASGYPENAFYGIPDQNDIALADAQEMAERVLLETYSLRSSYVNGYIVYTTFYRHCDMESNLWSFVFAPADKDPKKRAYRVEITSPSGDIDLCMEYALEEIW